MIRHGTYERKTPVLMPVARFDCRGCRTTFSRLPDFAAARRPGALQEIEDGMAVLAGSRGPWAAARRLFPERDEMSNAIRGLRCAFAAVSAFLAIVVTMRPDLFRGCPADLRAMRAALGTETLLVDLRREMTEQLAFLPPPVGFQPPVDGSGNARPGRPTEGRTLFRARRSAADRAGGRTDARNDGGDHHERHDRPTTGRTSPCFATAMISEALHLPPEEVARHLKRQSRRELAIPGSARRTVAVTTMRAWIRAWRRSGFDGLMPKRRKDRGSVRQPAGRRCRDPAGGPPGEHGPQRPAGHRAGAGHGRRPRRCRHRQPRRVHRLFVREGLMSAARTRRPGTCAASPPRRPASSGSRTSCTARRSGTARGRKRKTYLIALLDDATRVVPYAHFALGETAADYLVVLKEAILRRGLVERLFCDNGANFRSRQLMMVCGRLGISLLHARPYHPAGRERSRGSSGRFAGNSSPRSTRRTFPTWRPSTDGSAPGWRANTT